MVDISSNNRAWSDPDIVAHYAADTALQPPEARIFDELRPRMARWSMLDIGVGGGRTTRHFAPLVADYVGVDIAPGMVDHCRREFDSAHMGFAVADARELSSLGEGRFDFVLFSFNGIDTLVHQDRLRTLQQIRAVCRPGALFCFSTHNIHALDKLMHRKLRNWLRWKLLHARRVARVVAQRPDWAIVNDGAHRCRFDAYYVRPAAQVEQLKPWFTDARVFSLGGEELSPERSEGNDDDWLYYLCRAR